MAPYMESKGTSLVRYVSQPAAIALIFATLVSIVTVLERHYSLTEARRDHMVMELQLAKLRDVVEECEQFWKDYGFGIKNGSKINGSVDCKKALGACELESKSKCDSEVSKARKEAEVSARKDAESLYLRKLEAFSGNADKELVKNLKDQLSKLQKAFDQQMTEKLKMAKMMVTTEHSTTWNEKVLTSKAVEAAKLAISKCGDVYKKMTTQGGQVKGYGPICTATDQEIATYLNYTTRTNCPDDWFFVQDLVFVKNCFCLPKRTCFARSPPNYKAPLPFPRSLWDTKALMDENVRWELHSYKNFNAINTRTLGDCRNCFNLTLEDTRWVRERHGTIALEKVVKMKQGTLRIGLDVGGGSGSFAAKMAAYNCTILTTAMNIETLWDSNAGLPYMETIALRGLVPLHLPHKARLPFFDNTLDIIHAVNSIKYFEIPEFEELMFEWDRVLRPGGIIWFELFYTPVTEMPLYVAILDLFKYRRLYWNMSPKTDAPEREGEHVYLNCVLEKQRRKN